MDDEDFNFIGDSENPFSGMGDVDGIMKKVREEIELNFTDNPIRWVLVISAFILGATVASEGILQHPFFFISGGLFVAFFAWLFITPSGNLFGQGWLEVSRLQERSADEDSSGKEKICPNCGWQNPQRNNYCHDCGQNLIEQVSD